MNKTLDQFLEEVDRWKEASAEELEGLTFEERMAKFEETQRWLEEKLGRKLQVGSPRPREFYDPPVLQNPK